MNSRVGVWIDHTQAVIVTLTDGGEGVRRIASNVEQQLRRSGGAVSTTAFDPQHVPADDAREREFMRRLDLYYDEVIACIRDADAMLIFGPGEAKGELKKRIGKSKLGERVVGVEPADKMSERQIAAKVRRYFVHPTGAERAR